MNIKWTKQQLWGQTRYTADGVSGVYIDQEGDTYSLLEEKTPDNFEKIKEFESIQAATDFIMRHGFHEVESSEEVDESEIEDAVRFLGLNEIDENTFGRSWVYKGKKSSIQLKKYDDHLSLILLDAKKRYRSKQYDFNHVEKLVTDAEYFMQKSGMDSTIFSYHTSLDEKNITAKVKKDRITDKLVRTKSSNIWAYGINIADQKSGVGNMYLQFKGKTGGPDDIYIYYDVPVRTYRRFITAPSKGHFFWKYIRNVFQYSKLTGNKHGVLPNAINNW